MNFPGRKLRYLYDTPCRTFAAAVVTLVDETNVIGTRGWVQPAEAEGVDIHV